MLMKHGINNEKEVLAWIRSVGETAYLKHRGAGQFSGDTAYFGKNSRRWALKCYSKFMEILARVIICPLIYKSLK